MSKVMKIGTSHAIVIPVYIMIALGIERGDYMVWAVYSGNTITARKMTPDELASLKPAEIIA